MRRFSLLIVTSLLLTVSAARAQTLYAANGANLVTVNTSTGTTTTVGPTRVGATDVFLTGLAFQASTSTMFCSIGNDSSFGRQICTVNLSTAAVTVLPTVNSGPIPDIAFAPNGTLYGIRKSGQAALVSINLSTGAATQIGAPLVGGNGTGNGFAISSAGVAYWFGGDGILRTINLGTGVATPGPALTGGVGNNTFPAATFSPSGTLFASQGGNETNGTALVTVNTSTGVVTVFGSAFADGLAFNAAAVPPVSGPPASGVTISPAALALMAAALGGLAMWQLRRRATAN